MAFEKGDKSVTLLWDDTQGKRERKYLRLRGEWGRKVK